MSASRERELHVAVIGAGGTIAPAIVRDLADSPEVSGMTLLDVDETRAAAVAREHSAGKAAAHQVDARDPEQLSGALHGADVLVNSASYRLNLEAMRACLAAGCHYLDLGGLYWMTLRQLELGTEFERAGLLAVLGIGSSPGKTNLMALHGVRALGGDDVGAIEIAAAGRDPDARDDGRLRPPYAVQTLLDELMMEPVVIRDGDAEHVAPMSDGGVVDYGPPIGEAPTIFTLHSELATFGESFGCSAASFRLSLTPKLLEQLRALVGAPAEQVAAAARSAEPQSNRTVSVHVVTVSAPGERRVTVRSVTEPHFGLGGSIVSTATPAAATVRLMARGWVPAVGVRPPERCIDPDQMFAELAPRGCTITLSGP
jgi:saccharopine dehydrogenase (NAD+, L-lysine-forming)